MVPQNSLVLKQSARVVIQENSVKLMASTKHLGTVPQDTSAEKTHLLVNLQMASLVMFVGLGIIVLLAQVAHFHVPQDHT